MIAAIALLAFQGGGGPLPQEPLRRAEIRVFDAATNELLCDLKAGEVTPAAGGRLSIVQPLATMFVRDREGKVQRFQIRAERATYEQAEQRLHAQGAVRIESPEGLSFRAGGAIVDFKRQRVETEEAFRMAKPGLELLGTGLTGRLDLTEGSIARNAQVSLFGSVRDVLSREPSGEPEPVRTTLRGDGPMMFSQIGGKVSVTMDSGVDYLREDAKGTLAARGGSGKLEGTQPEVGEFRIDTVDLAGGVELVDGQGGQAAGERLRVRGDRLEVTHAERSMLAFEGHELTAREIRFDRAAGRVEARGDPSARLAGETGADIDAAEIDLSLQAGEQGWRIRELQARGGVTARREGVRVVAPMMAVRGRAIHALGPKHLEFEADGKRYYATARGEARLLENGLDLERDALVAGPDLRMSADRITAFRGGDGKIESLSGHGAVRLRIRSEEGETATLYGREATLAGSKARVRAEPEAVLISSERRIWAAEIELDRESGRFTARGEGRPARMKFLASPR
jgi:lipopolysaccharide export system protein LptA